nr:unnamed protein product [Callosobruchus chinensis]
MQNYNISFGHPRSYTCQICEKLENYIALDEVPEAKIKLHSLKEKSTLDKTQASIEVLCFDYQQNMSIPHTPAVDVFYKRQLWSLPTRKLYDIYPLPIKPLKLENVRYLANKYVPKNDQWYYGIVYKAVGPEVPQETVNSNDENVEVEMF